MSHDLDLYFPYDNGLGANVLEAQWRDMGRNWLTDGPIYGGSGLSNFAPSTTAGRNIIVGSGQCWVAGAFGELSTPYTLAFSANSSGNPRIDLVVLRNDFSLNKIVLDVLQGTPSGSPVTPTLTQNTAMWEIPLFALTLANGYTSIAAWIDVRVFAQGRPPGGPVLVACTASAGSGQSIPNNVATPVNYAATEYDPVSICNLGTNIFTIPPGGWGIWHIDAWLEFVGALTSGSVLLQLQKNGTTIHTFDERANNAAAQVVQGHRSLLLAATDQLEILVLQNSGAAHTVSGAVASFEYRGPVS